MEHGKCHQLLDSLSAYVDGELGEEFCNLIESHMDGCENCRIVVDTLRKTVSLYQSTAPAPSLPGSVRERLFRRLEIEEFLGLDAANKR